MEENGLISRIAKELETTRRDTQAAAAGVEILRRQLAAEFTKLPEFFWENVQRQLRKLPETAEGFTDERIAELRAELRPLFEQETARITDELVIDPSWHDAETAFIDKNHSLWKSIKTAEADINRALRKYNIVPIGIHAWTWISETANNITQVQFPSAKKELYDLVKRVAYLENRLNEEIRLMKMHERLDQL